MIWLDRFGSLSSGGRWVENIDIDGVRYSVYLAEKWGDGWGYIAFVRSKPQSGAGTLDLVQFLSYLRDQNLITGNEYIASIELGNEIVGGSGETILNQFEVSVR